jgi:hypothetical protein
MYEMYLALFLKAGCDMKEITSPVGNKNKGPTGMGDNELSNFII